MVEEAPASLRAPGASVVRAFTSDRQKHETAAEEGILTKIVMERTAHLRPGTQFIKSFWMTEGVRATHTSVVRNAVHKVNKQPVSIKFYGRMEDFNRERQLYSLAISPQFVPMMYFCEEGSEDLPPFIITERGDFTLADVLRKSRPPPQQQKILLHDVACALSQLHSMGLVQMDIRPANVMFFGCVCVGGEAWRGAMRGMLASPAGGDGAGWPCSRCTPSTHAHPPLTPSPLTFAARRAPGSWWTLRTGRGRGRRRTCRTRCATPRQRSRPPTWQARPPPPPTPPLTCSRWASWPTRS
jgi:hypothetical protein